MQLNMYNAYIKRLIDIIISGIGIIVLIPLWLVISIAIAVDDPGPIFYTQRRIGINEKYFRIIKFRTMKVNTPKDIPTHKLDNADSYITKIGFFLRKTSLDELPQLFNIITSDMAIIGPRPALWNQYDLITERNKYGANAIRPGLTGWAQINGRDELTIADKARYDGEYVKKMSFWFDCKCFLGSILPVLRHDGVLEGGIKNRPDKNNRC